MAALELLQSSSSMRSENASKKLCAVVVEVCVCSSLLLAGEQDLRNLAKTKVKKRLKIAINISVGHFENCYSVLQGSANVASVMHQVH